MVEAKKSLAEAITEYRTSLTANANEYATSVALARSGTRWEAAETETIFVSLTNKDKQNTTAYIDLYRLYIAEKQTPTPKTF